MELTDSLKSLCIETATSLKGSARRLLMARTVKERGAGGQRRAERELGWGRMTIRKGTHELESGFTCLDAFAARGRKRVEVRRQLITQKGYADDDLPTVQTITAKLNALGYYPKK